MNVTLNTSEGFFQLRAGAICVRDERVLLHHALGDSRWSLPGGRIALGEDSAATLVRELAEELHTTATIDRLVATVELCDRGVDGTVFHEVAFYYLVQLPDVPCFEEPFVGPEVGFPAEFWWCPRSALASIDIVPASIRSLIAALPSTYVHIHAHQAEYVLQRESFVPTDGETHASPLM
jgi:8-oxo-dGTP pyrophosphatase MutT (NUDIX family)